MMFYTVAYDITNDRRRTAVAKILLDFGARIQYSVFECNTDRRAFLRLQDRIQNAVNPKEDTVTFYHLCRSCERGSNGSESTRGLTMPSTLFRISNEGW